MKKKVRKKEGGIKIGVYVSIYIRAKFGPAGAELKAVRYEQIFMRK